MTAGTDQWSWWRDALTGKPVDSEVGNPRSGFWKAPQDEPVAIWRDEAGTVCCERIRFGGGARMSLDEIDMLYASASRYPLDEETYSAARDGNPPLGFKTRLTGKECQAGVVWSLELGRKKLGEVPQEVQEAHETAGAAESCRGAAPVATGHTFAGERTPDILMLEQVSALGATVKTWLAGVGGAPRNKAEADQLADYATQFKTLAKKAEDARATAKKPHLDAGREVDAAWKRPIDNAEGSRKRCLDIAQAWMDGENARLRAEAEKARASAADGAAAAPAEPEKITGLGNMRTVSTRERSIFVVTDAREYLRHLLTLNTDLPAEIVEAAEKAARRRAEEAPGVEKRTERKAA